MGKDNKVAREEEKMQGIISMTGLIAYLVASIEKMKDPRQPSPNTTYSLKDAVLGGFSLFLMQCESFLNIKDNCIVATVGIIFKLYSVPSKYLVTIKSAISWIKSQPIRYLWCLVTFINY
jgi:hypothetical protein